MTFNPVPNEKHGGNGGKSSQDEASITLPDEKHEGTERTEGTANKDGASSGFPTQKHEGTERTMLVPEAQFPEIQRPCFAVYARKTKIGDNKELRPGVYFHGLNQSKGSEEATPVDQWICSPLYVEAITSNDGADFGRLLHFINTLGRWRDWAMPMEMLKGSGEDMRGELLNMGVEIDPSSFKLLNHYLQSQHPKRKVIAATTTGWQSPELFIMPQRNIGKGDAIYQNETARLDDFRQAGTLEGWTAGIGARCTGNPLLMLGVCAAFAGPLLYHLKRQGGGLHIVGDSSIGKTAVVQASASVWGHGEQFMRTWRATSNGLEGVASLHNDTLLALDEMGEADPREIGAVIYEVANGAGKSRANRSGAARSHRRWRVMLLSSGEVGLSDYMTEGGKRSRAGQEIRLLDIPAQRTFGAWDDLHGLPSGQQFTDALLRTSATHYGYAGPIFIEYLLKDGVIDDLPGALEDLCKQYPTGTGQEHRAAERFAILALAGELAIKWGLLPATEGAARDAMLALFDSWRGNRGQGQGEDARILANVSNFISRHGESMFSSVVENPDTSSVKDRAGWWKTDWVDNEQRRVWLFTSEGLQRASPGYNINRILDAVEKAGWITERNPEKRSKRVRVGGQNPLLYHLSLLDETC
jgi:putative DNA primase/helicase